MERRKFLRTLTTAGAGVFLSNNLLACTNKIISSASPAAGRNPNVIVILADDLGYGDLSCYGASAFQTKGIDRIAANGIRFTNGYATSATCTPSRYALLTGLYPWRKKEARVLRGDAPLLIDVSQQTLPAIFKKADYKTGVVGKWHLGLGNGSINWNEKISPGPNEIGFDYSFIMPATNDRVPTAFCENGNIVGLLSSDPLEVNYKQNFSGEPTGKENPELLKLHPSQGHDMSIHNGISRIGFQKGGKIALWKDEEMGDKFLEKAKDFISGNKKNSFFLYYALQQPHVPRTPNERFVGKSGLGPRGDSIMEADWCVGQLLDYLDELKIAEDTIVIFSSDNGPVLDDGYKDEAVEKNGTHNPAGNLRGGKYSLYDGGTHVPFIVQWKDHIKPGISDAIVCQMDLAASFSNLLGKGYTYGDSEDVMNSLQGKTDTGRKDIVLEGSGGKVAYRRGNWVLIPPYKGPAKFLDVNIESGYSSEYQLYNIKDDPGEKRNIYKDNTQIADEMLKAFEGIKTKY